MAYLQDYTCMDCDKKFQSTVGNAAYPRCGACQTTKDIIDKRAHIEHLSSLSIEKRLQKIEEWIYDFKPKYVPPPTY